MLFSVVGLNVWFVASSLVSLDEERREMAAGQRVMTQKKKIVAFHKILTGPVRNHCGTSFRKSFLMFFNQVDLKD